MSLPERVVALTLIRHGWPTFGWWLGAWRWTTKPAAGAAKNSIAAAQTAAIRKRGMQDLLGRLRPQDMPGVPLTPAPHAPPRRAPPPRGGIRIRGLGGLSRRRRSSDGGRGAPRHERAAWARARPRPEPRRRPEPLRRPGARARRDAAGGARRLARRRRRPPASRGSPRPAGSAARSLRADERAGARGRRPRPRRR